MLRERPPALGTCTDPATGDGPWDDWAARTTARRKNARAGILRNRQTDRWMALLYAEGHLHRLLTADTHADAVAEIDGYMRDWRTR